MDKRLDLVRSMVANGSRSETGYIQAVYGRRWCMFFPHTSALSQAAFRRQRQRPELTSTLICIFLGTPCT